MAIEGKPENTPETRPWRDGGSCWHRGRFGTVTYIAGQTARLTMDDDSQRMVPVEELERPNTTATARFYNYVTHQGMESRDWGPAPDLEVLDALNESVSAAVASSERQDSR